MNVGKIEINVKEKIQNITVNDNLMNQKSKIEMKEDNKNRKRQKIKIRSYCSKCYQFFENGPYSKMCKNHLEKCCNLIECQKNNPDSETNPCIRKFSNINSANRHTHCLTQKDVDLWDPNCEIQKCLSKKKTAENPFNEINNKNIFLSNINKLN